MKTFCIWASSSDVVYLFFFIYFFFRGGSDGHFVWRSGTGWAILVGLIRNTIE